MLKIIVFSKMIFEILQLPNMIWVYCYFLSRSLSGKNICIFIFRYWILPNRPGSWTGYWRFCPKAVIFLGSFHEFLHGNSQIQSCPKTLGSSNERKFRPKKPKIYDAQNTQVKLNYVMLEPFYGRFHRPLTLLLIHHWTQLSYAV